MNTGSPQASTQLCSNSATRFSLGSFKPLRPTRYSEGVWALIIYPMSPHLHSKAGVHGSAQTPEARAQAFLLEMVGGSVLRSWRYKDLVGREPGHRQDGQRFPFFLRIGVFTGTHQREGPITEQKAQTRIWLKGNTRVGKYCFSDMDQPEDIKCLGLLRTGTRSCCPSGNQLHCLF